MTSPAKSAVDNPVDRWGTILGWALYPMIALLVLVDLRIGLGGKPEPISARFVGFAILAGLSLPFWWQRRDEVSRTGRLLLGLFGSILSYALVSSMVTTQPLMQKVLVARHYLVLPVVEACLTLLAAWGLVLAVPASRRRDWLWWGGAVLLVASLLEWPRMAAAQNSARLATGMGGAATVHVALLTTTALFVGAALQGHRRHTSWALAGLGLVEVLATGSRSGLLCLMVAAALLVVWALGRGMGRTIWWVVGVGVALVGVLMAVFPPLRRILSLGDDMRQQNVRTAWDVFTISWHNQLFGAGTGRVWPWLAFETGRLKILWRGQVTGEFGKQLTNPHSTFLAVAVELGLLCLLVLLAFCAVLVCRMVREWRDGQDTWAFVVAVGLVASLVANLFDYYLLKNFGVSVWWWLVLATFLGTSQSGRSRPALHGGATSAPHAPGAHASWRRSPRRVARPESATAR